ncbi:MAG: cytochrome b/b6 domain-containing protein [Burkholderiales bacterium]|nr:cytochrome b/b6 domain-containing protein [Burkholderiales bacterium]
MPTPVRPAAPLPPAPPAPGAAAASAAASTTVHPPWLRLAHWLNAIAVVLLVLSGWRIYDAAPFLGLRIPAQFTLGGWLGGALLWHFAAMWLLLANGLVYLGLNLATGRARRKFWPISARAVLADLRAALRGRLSHADPHTYNAVQRAAYVFVTLDTLLIVLSGLVLWKSVQFPLLRELLGGYEVARRVHFVAMAGLVAFVAVHLAMVALVPRTLLAMIRGR